MHFFFSFVCTFSTPQLAFKGSESSIGCDRRKWTETNLPFVHWNCSSFQFSRNKTFEFPFHAFFFRKLFTFSLSNFFSHRRVMHKKLYGWYRELWTFESRFAAYFPAGNRFPFFTKEIQLLSSQTVITSRTKENREKEVRSCGMEQKRIKKTFKNNGLMRPKRRWKNWIGSEMPAFYGKEWKKRSRKKSVSWWSRRKKLKEIVHNWTSNVTILLTSYTESRK